MIIYVVGFAATLLLLYIAYKVVVAIREYLEFSSEEDEDDYHY